MTIQELGAHLGQRVRVVDEDHGWFNQTGLLMAVQSHLKKPSGVISSQLARVLMGDGAVRSFRPEQLTRA